MKRLHWTCALRGGASLTATAFAAPLLIAGAHAAVVISSQPTQNMSCSAGVCAPTAKDAVLNVGDLQTMLASGNVSVTTTGSGVQAKDIDVKAALSWSTSSVLTLDAYSSLTIDKAVAVEGQAGLSILTNDGGSGGVLSFGRGGTVTFANLSSALSINGTAYALVNTIKSLASAIAGNPSGAYALASSYNASQDGTYTTVPIPTVFNGNFEGLGNAISNLSIDDANDTEVGLFAEVDADGTLRDISMPQANVSGAAFQAAVGPLVGFNDGTIVGASASGVVAAQNEENSFAGGLVGFHEDGTVMLSNATTKVSGFSAGGLIGRALFSDVSESFATGRVSGSGYVGGLLGFTDGGTVANAYATGVVRGPVSSSTYVGGFAGEIGERAQISDSYSIGRVKGGIGGSNGTRGGFVGTISFDVTFTDSYWDITTNGIHLKGIGNAKDELGLTGLTTEQFQSGLPKGFRKSIWTEDPDINGGLPYLLANPPR